MMPAGYFQIPWRAFRRAFYSRRSYMGRPELRFGALVLDDVLIGWRAKIFRRRQPRHACFAEGCCHVSSRRRLIISVVASYAAGEAPQHMPTPASLRSTLSHCYRRFRRLYRARRLVTINIFAAARQVTPITLVADTRDILLPT